MSSFITEAAQTGAWIALSLVLMAAGYGVLDLLTPGPLRHQAGTHVNAAVLLGSKLLAVAVIVTGSVLAAPDELGPGLTQAAAYAVGGLAVSSLVFLGLDALLPARLRDLVTNAQFAPAVVVVAAADLGVALVIAAAVS